MRFGRVVGSVSSLRGIGSIDTYSNWIPALRIITKVGREIPSIAIPVRDVYFTNRMPFVSCPKAALRNLPIADD